MNSAGMTERERVALAHEIAMATRNGAPALHCACPGDASLASKTLAASVPASALDQALPQPSSTSSEARRFLSLSRDAGFRSVCVQPPLAALAVRMLHGSGTKVGSFIGFPSSSALTPAKCLEAQLLLRIGVRELTMIADVGALRSGDLDAAYIDIREVSKIAACRNAKLNVFLELPLLSGRRKVEACVVAKLAGASAVLSATGFDDCNAEPADIELMRGAVGGDLAIVAAGGVHTAATASRMLGAGATRVCTSHGLEIAGVGHSEALDSALSRSVVRISSSHRPPGQPEAPRSKASP